MGGSSSKSPLELLRISCCARLPNFAGLLAHHRLALLATEGLGKLRHIRKRLVGAPNLRPTEEEALLGSKAVLVQRPRFACNRLFIRGVGDRQTAQVRDAFP